MDKTKILLHVKRLLEHRNLVLALVVLATFVAVLEGDPGGQPITNPIALPT